MLKRALLAFVALAAGAAAGAVLHAALSRGDSLFSWKQPAYLGVTDGRLARCKRTPNCVSSQADPADAVHYVAPIAFKGGSVEAMAAVREVLAHMQRCTVLRHEENYLYAEFRSKLMGYVDDVEFVHDPGAGVIHVRSASRLGRSDHGVNRKRVESIRTRLGKGAGG